MSKFDSMKFVFVCIIIIIQRKSPLCSILMDGDDRSSCTRHAFHLNSIFTKKLNAQETKWILRTSSSLLIQLKMISLRAVMKELWREQVYTHHTRFRSRRADGDGEKTVCVCALLKRNHRAHSWHYKRMKWHTRKVTQASVTVSFTTIHDVVIHRARAAPSIQFCDTKCQTENNIKWMKNNTAGAHLLYLWCCCCWWCCTMATTMAASKCEPICWIPFRVHALHSQRPNKKWWIFVCITSNLGDVMHLSLCWEAHAK